MSCLSKPAARPPAVSSVWFYCWVWINIPLKRAKPDSGRWGLAVPSSLLLIFFTETGQLGAWAVPGVCPWLPLPHVLALSALGLKSDQGWKGQGHRLQKWTGLVPTLLSACCVAVGKVLCFSEPLSSYLLNMDETIYFPGCYGN